MHPYIKIRRCGGLEILAMKGKIKVDNTLEARLGNINSLEARLGNIKALEARLGNSNTLKARLLGNIYSLEAWKY